LPALLEPIWVGLNAKIEAIPVMTAEDLRIALGRMG
jgi:hypothetical protein